MKARIALITVLTNDVPKMKQFYQDVLGFSIKSEMDGYAEFVNEGVRFSVCTRQVMADITGGHESFRAELKGQAFELAFPCESSEDVERSYYDIVAKGAIPIKEPATMPWGQTTAFFADPEGNIHEIFAD
ncbi:VOC family protein [Alicyclobacillus fastidiosus]|uniref:VOC family protein n=1 Tax=Alicyclobacillus fastidiosus TaxID=392011 RepID=A0ABY6ZKN4_9BACL|nr:VOC family protein [Alicyclobacillus fastidiosus]WAH43485.1 VOC family protein [Alicyclobacillus fastidiosus]GMA59646.1 glyoxalase/bleomycin resistance/dioxygenase family protein [Alicyclobacillus fastidiosus]